MFQLLIGGFGGAGTRDEHDPQATPDPVLMLSDNLPHPAPDAVTHDCAADPLRCDETGSKWLGVIRLQDTQDEERAAMRRALILDAEELS